MIPDKSGENLNPRDVTKISCAIHVSRHADIQAHKQVKSQYIESLHLFRLLILLQPNWSRGQPSKLQKCLSFITVTMVLNLGIVALMIMRNGLSLNLAGKHAAQMDDLRFYVLFISVSVISGRWEVDNERLCAMELRLRL